MNNLKRNENESLLGYYKRLVDNRKEYDLDYSELGEIILGESKYSSDNVRKAVYLLKPILEKLEEDYFIFSTKKVAFRPRIPISKHCPCRI